MTLHAYKYLLGFKNPWQGHALLYSPGLCLTLYVRPRGTETPSQASWLLFCSQVLQVIGTQGFFLSGDFNSRLKVMF